MDPSTEHTDLIVRVLAGDASHEEKDALQQWLDASPANAKYFEDLQMLWLESGKPVQFDDSLLKEDWKKTYEKITEIRKNDSVVRKPSRTLYVLTRIAAALLLFIGVFYFVQKIYPPKIELITQADIRTVTLPDGSEVTLNANSTFSYPEEFDADTRIVSLEGEAFFNISRDAKKPFMVKTAHTTTEVLGTSFSINTRHESVTVTVVTGKVIFYEGKTTVVELTPGEKGIYSKGVVSETLNRDQNFLSWRTNVLDFRNATLAAFSHDVARHYKIPVVIHSKSLAACPITARFEDQSFEEVLEELKLLFPVRITMQGDTVLIDGEGCDPLN